MRSRLPLALAAGLALAAAGFAPLPRPKDKKADPKDAAKAIQGTWELTGVERAGRNLQMPAGYKMTIKITEKGFTQHISFKGTERETPEADITVNAAKSPPWFDVTNKGAATTRMKGVYKVDGDKLVLVYATAKADRPEKVEGELAQSQMRMTLKRVKP
jgi:uncharacterized protein (TIGR03067 family)